jgi:hypothetical protein
MAGDKLSHGEYQCFRLIAFSDARQVDPTRFAKVAIGGFKVR